MSILYSLIFFLLFPTFFFLARLARRRAAARSTPDETDFALEDIHSLLLQGKLTRDEFERARASILSRRRSTLKNATPRQRGFEVLEPRNPN